MKFNFKDPNPPEKIFLDNKLAKEKKGPYILLRVASKKKLDEIREQTHTKVKENIRGIIHESYDVDEDKDDLLLWGYCMPGWGELKDEEGSEIPYSPKNAVFLISENPYFANLVSAKLDEVRRRAEKRAKEKEKN